MMKKLFVNKKAAHGNLIKLLNKNKKSAESKFYYTLWVEDKFGSNEQCLIFSQSDISKIKDVKYCDFQDQMGLGRLYRLGNASSYFVKIKGLDKSEKVVRLSSTVISNGITRAKKNLEDIPQKGFIQDLLD